MTYEDHIRAMAEARAALQEAEDALRTAEAAEQEARNRSGLARQAFNQFVQEGVEATCSSVSGDTSTADTLARALRS